MHQVLDECTSNKITQWANLKHLKTTYKWISWNTSKTSTAEKCSWSSLFFYKMIQKINITLWFYKKGRNSCNLIIILQQITDLAITLAWCLGVAKHRRSLDQSIASMQYYTWRLFIKTSTSVFNPLSANLTKCSNTLNLSGTVGKLFECVQPICGVDP